MWKNVLAELLPVTSWGVVWMMRRVLACFLAALLIAALVPAGAFAKEEELSFFGNEFEIDTPEQWATGDLDEGKLVIDSDVGGGAIKLADGVAEATYTSAVISMPEGKSFEYLVMSWNADCPEGTWIEVTASVWLDKHEKWSEPYLTWGKWSPFIKRSSHASYSSTESPYVNINWDEFYVRGDPAQGDTASKVRLQVILHRDDASLPSPVLWYLHGTTQITGQDPVKVFRDGLGENPDFGDFQEVEVPQYSQIIRSPNIGGVMCNAATTAMLLNSVSQMAGQPLNLLPEEVAMGCYDFRPNAFGNWAFAMACAGSYGYKAYVDYTTIEGIKRHLKSGYAVGASVAYSTDPEAPNYLENAYGSTDGHLIVLRGYQKIGDVEYFISNDAFNPSNETVRKLYRVDQFENVWSRNTIYLLKPGKVDGVGNYPVKRIIADLEEVEPYKYVLKYDDAGTAKQVVTPKADSSYSSRHGFIAYITEPEVFSGSSPSVYSYINVAQNQSDQITLQDEVVTHNDFRLYVANQDAHCGKLFIFDKDEGSDVKHYPSTALTTINKAYTVSDTEISPNDKDIVWGETTVDEFLSGLKGRPGATLKLFDKDADVKDAAEFNSTPGKTGDSTLEEGDFVGVLASDGTTLQKYSITAGVALLPMPDLRFEFSDVSLYHYQFPFTNPLHGKLGDAKVTYTTSNSNVAKVNAETGEVTPHNVGNDVVITAHIPSDGVYQAYTISYTLDVLRGTIEGFHWGTIIPPWIGQEPPKVYIPSPKDPYELFYFSPPDEPLFTWTGQLEDGKFKEGEAYSVSIRLQSNDYPGGNSAYFYANPFTAEMIKDLPKVGDWAGDAYVTGVTVTRNNNYRLTIKIDYSPLKRHESHPLPPSLAQSVISALAVWGEDGVSVQVQDDQVNTALTAALAEGAAGDAKVTVHVSAPQGQGAVKVTLSGAAVATLAGEDRAVLAVSTPLGSFTLGQEALDTLAALSDDSDKVEFVMEPFAVDPDGLLEEVRDYLGDAAVWRIGVRIGDGEVQPLPGAYEVFIPYAAGPDEDTGALTVFALDGLEGLTKLEDVSYDSVRRGFVATARGASQFFISKNVAKLVTDFKDVKKADWYYPGVKFVAEMGLMNGISEDSFAPYGDMSRAMLVATLYRYAGSPTVDGSADFADVLDGQWYTDAVAWAREQGIVEGYGNGLFGTHDLVSRQEFATILYRFAVKRGGVPMRTEDLSGFADAGKVAPWAETAMQWAVAQGILQGRGNNMLAPGGSCNRAEAATILMRYAGLAE